MYPFLLFFHSVFRWFVLASLLYAILRACKGYAGNKAFTSADDSMRHWTATISHIQLTTGFILYFKSPVTGYFFAHFSEAIQHLDQVFFGIIHILLMIVSVALVTVGSALAKRKTGDKEKFRTMLVWFSIALCIIFMAIPWPFSPLANRPYFRIF